MNKEYFLLEDKIEEIKSKFAIKNGWLKIYENEPKISDNPSDSSCVYCCLISNDKVEENSKGGSWPILMGSEGKPSICGDNSYKTNDKEGLEPFLFYKSFFLQEKLVKYVDIAEEFILYFRLYEKGNDKQNRIFYYVTDYGELDAVLTIEPNLIKVKIKYLKEYITMRDMNFVICYEFMRVFEEIPSDWNIKHKNELIKEKDFVYSHSIKFDDGPQSWIMGKVFIKPNEIKKSHFDLPVSKNESFIIAVDDEGNSIYESCEESSGITYFKKEVLNKYYNEPDKYKVDGFSVTSKFFRLKIDNNRNEYIPVFLFNLEILPEMEQLHWKQYNIPPKEGMGISRRYRGTMLEGEWAGQPETVDLLFKSKYKSFNQNWEKKFGWKLYKPLDKQDEYLFTALHLITSNNIKAFCEQTLTVVKLVIDRLNEEELKKGLDLDLGDKGITKFEKFLKSKRVESPDEFEFLRNLQDLRSGLIAHAFSKSNKKCEKAIKYFDVESDNYVEVLKVIFIKSLRIFNNLEKYLELNK